jgi:hypothetical protein
MMADVLGVRETRVRCRPILTSRARYSVLDTEAAHKLRQIGGAIWIDVLAAPHRAASLPLSALWVPLPHHNIPGMLWLPDIGRGSLSSELEG